MINNKNIKEGMVVRSSDGEKLGKVFAVSDGEFHIEKGLFFPKDYLVRYSEVSDIRNGEIYLNHGRDALRGLADGGTLTGRTGAMGTATGAAMGMKDKIGDVPRTNLKDRDVRDRDRLVTHHEELGVTKERYAAGEAEIRKVVREEVKHIDVPLMHEEVEVVRRAASPTDGDTDWSEQRIRIPLEEERAHLEKRVVADEAVELRKRPIEEHRDYEGRVRREELEDVKVVRRTEADMDEDTRRTLRSDSDVNNPLKRS